MNNKNLVANITAGSSEKGVIQSKEITGLLVYLVAAPLPTDIFSAQLITDDGKVKQLMPRMGLDVLASISDIEFGNYTESIGSTYHFIIPLGKLDLQEGDRLEYVIENTHATIAKAVRVYELNEFDDSDHMLQCVITSNLSETFDAVDTAFIVRSGDPFDTDNDVDVLIKDGEDSHYSDVLGYIAENRALNQIDPGVSLVALKIFDNNDEIPDKVSFNITGTTEGISLMIYQKIEESRRVSRSNVKRVMRRATKMRGIETRNPSRARALKRAGRVSGYSYAMLQRARRMTVK